MNLSLRLSILLLTALPASASAQIGGFDQLFDRITDISVFGTRSWLHPKPKTLTAGTPGESVKGGPLPGYGLELSFKVGEVERISGRRRADTTSLVLFELALGYSQISGFRAQDTTFDFRGALRELPSLTVYASWLPDRRVSFYTGIRSGFAELHNAQFYDSGDDGPVYPIEAQTIQAGLVAGIFAEVFNLDFLLEPSYVYRKFPSLKIDTEALVIPKRFPREFDFSGFVLSFGVQVPIGSKEESGK
jgi:hypothetical protein